MKKILMLVSLSAVWCCTGCTKEEEKKEEAVRYQVTSPLVSDTTITKEYVSQIQAIRHIEMRAQQRGYIQNIFVDEGQYVHQGQMMFQIMPKLYEAELQKAEAEANFATIEYQNTKKLADNKIVAPNELSMANAKLDKAKAEVSLAQTHLGFTKIKAPFSGIMDHFHVRQGSLVDEGDLLTTLSDNSRMWVYFNVPEAEYLDYRTKAQSGDLTNVHLLMANNQLFPFSGKVETIEADFNNETGNIAFRATFPNPKGLLRHGETGTVQMTLPLKHALIIPQKATFEVLDKKYVYVVDKDNVIRSREITVAAEMPHIFVVRSGLTKTDKILLEGLRQVKENEKIQYKFEQPAAVIAHLSLYAE
ncbi:MULTISPECIES: efflux RND transporter periplasmic adaptor subunit [Spirosoma]|uniref:Efflux RND transporter periplasmic adaptor subunit n=1 Tax=Spirosoma sordidisoli TaxID=2502893 RepID=A0A4V1RWW8_9BACT|nr:MULTISPECIES: efflux RND transporter periplasmic adaptor subunit [Spirosoma]RYC71718.1 efflux RND transporter periplasmic adaptor subunit [Spirosoma sordidisoli]